MRMAADQKPLAGKIQEWVTSQGFALEMRAAAVLRRAGFITRQSAHYYDREEAKFRETDVFATHPESNASAAVHLIAECKSGTQPWVNLFSSEVLAGLDPREIFAVLSHEASDRMRLVERGSAFVLPWMNQGSGCGYSFRKALVSGGKDDGYAAAMSVCKAAQWAVLNHQGDRRKLPAFGFAIPVIVVDTPLFHCYLSESGDVKVGQVDRTEFLFESRVIYETVVRIRVIHIDALPVLAREVIDGARAYLQLKRD